MANGLSIFSIKDNTVFSNGPKSLPKKPPGLTYFKQLSFWKFYISWWPFSKALGSVETGVLVNNILWAKLFSSLEFFRIYSRF